MRTGRCGHYGGRVRRLLSSVMSKLRRSTPPPPPGRRTVTQYEPPEGRHLVYAPQLDGRADPGEIVWTWVSFEEDAHRGKDRPVLVVGRDQSVLLGLMLTSNAERGGEHNWFPLGSGAWDPDGRPSWVRLDRVLRVPE